MPHINPESFVGIIGSSTSGACAASFPSYKTAGLPMVSPSATKDSLTDPTSSDFGGPIFHRVCSIDKQEGAALLRHAIKDITKPRIYIVDNASSYGTTLNTSIQQSIIEVARRLGSSISLVGRASSVNYAITDTTSNLLALALTGVGSDIVNKQANVVIYCGYVEALNLVSALRAKDYTGVFACGGGSYDPIFLSPSGSNARIMSESIPFQNIATAQQLSDFTAITGVKVPSDFVSETINAANVFLTCIEKGCTTRESILEYMNTPTHTFPDIITGGTFSFDKNGDNTNQHLGAYVVDSTGKQFNYVGIA